MNLADLLVKKKKDFYCCSDETELTKVNIDHLF